VILLIAVTNLPIPDIVLVLYLELSDGVQNEIPLPNPWRVKANGKII